MSRNTLDVRRLHRLALARHDHLRIDVDTGAGVSGSNLVRGEYRGERPLLGLVKQEGVHGDLIGTFWANVYLITQRLYESLRTLGISGWDVVPIQIEDQREALSSVYLLTVTGRSGPIHEVGIGRYLDARDWDGSDVFLPANSRGILVVGDAADLLKEERFKDLELETAGLEPLER